MCLVGMPQVLLYKVVTGICGISSGCGPVMAGAGDFGFLSGDVLAFSFGGIEAFERMRWGRTADVLGSLLRWAGDGGCE